MRKVVELHVNARANGEAGCVFRRVSDVMHGVEALDGAEIGEDETTKTPLLAKDGLEQKRICGDGNAVNLVISGHGGHGVSFTKGGLEGLQHHGAKLALADVYGRSIGAAFRRAVTGKVLGLGDNGVVAVEAVALRATHVGKAKLAGEIRIFAEVFFNAPPAGSRARSSTGPRIIATPVARASAAMAPPVCCAICGFHVAARLIGRGKYGAGIEAVQTLFDKESGNAETIVRDNPLLDAVGLLRRGIEVMNAAHPEIAPEALRLLRKEGGIERGVCIVGVARKRCSGRRSTYPVASPSPPTSCAPKKIVNADFDWTRWLACRGAVAAAIARSVG